MLTRQRVDGLDVQVVGRLVQQQHVRLLERQPRKGHSRPLPGREAAHWHDVTLADQRKSSHSCQHLLLLVPGVLGHHVLVGRFVEVHLFGNMLQTGRGS